MYNVKVFSACYDNNVSRNTIWQLGIGFPYALCNSQEKPKGAEVAFGHKSNDNFDVTVYRTKAEILLFHFVKLTHL